MKSLAHKYSSASQGEMSQPDYILYHRAVSIPIEGVYGTDFTGEVLISRLSQRDLQKAILTADKAFRLKDCQTHQSLKHITGPGIPSELSWLKIWDMAIYGSWSKRD